MRPDPLHWLMYAFGAGLPPRNRDWVLHDITSPWWRVRALVRSVVQFLPFAALIVLLLPVEMWVRFMAVGAGLVIGLIYALAYQDEAAESRALKAGWPRGYAQSVRDDLRRDDAAERRYDERYRGGGSGPVSR